MGKRNGGPKTQSKIINNLNEIKDSDEMMTVRRGQGQIE